MPPKFNEDEWGDDADAVSRPKAAKKKVLSRAKILPPEEGNGTVTEIFPNQSAVRLDGAANPALCRYRMSTLAFGSANRERSPVCVGDRVRVEAGVIVGRCVRRNCIIRPAPNARDPLLHVLAANLDCLVIVAAAREPEFSGGIVDRFLVAASAQKIQQILCINKADLIEADEGRPWSHYPAAGVMLVKASARSGRGTERLAALLRPHPVADLELGHVPVHAVQAAPADEGVRVFQIQVQADIFAREEIRPHPAAARLRLFNAGNIQRPRHPGEQLGSRFAHGRIFLGPVAGGGDAEREPLAFEFVREIQQEGIHRTPTARRCASSHAVSSGVRSGLGGG